MGKNIHNESASPAGRGKSLKVLIEKNFDHEGETYEPGKTFVLPDGVAAKSVEELEKEVEIEQAGEIESGPGPEGTAEGERSEEGEPDVWGELESELEEPSITENA
ncbi:hypothetical protein AKJ39_03290 [candidate division MSBL1 archaeon SCGC-AAA259J03]|uniref:Uncharacterized protein n=1 Tax=candidate division MSBL1 archaeon SCGC-AAA259J03 TaxID=1698269 RepID=A0A656YVR5_9EURY|nr:hypothetical protein AKJ39_03290 [candidate division MSBL1 archaeon SCGC-AAA259J03]